MSKSILTLLALSLALQLHAQTFSSTVNETIPDDGSVVMYNIEVSGLPSVIDTSFGLESVCLNMTHTYTEDMMVNLMAPNGKVILLFAGVGGGGHNFFNTCLQGTGPVISTGTPPFSGSFQSMGILGNMNKGQNPNGTWTLILHDTYPFADQGFLIDWSISFGNNPAKPFAYVSSNLPIVKLTSTNGPIVDEPKVPALMQIIDNGPGQRNFADQTNYAYEGLIMVEWQGFTGPYYPKKNYDFDLVDDQLNKIDTSILGFPAENDYIFKAEYLDHTLIKNSVTYEMARRMGRYAPRTRPCEIVLDDEYVGMYVLTEKVKRDKSRVDVARLSPEDIDGDALTGGYIIEMNINNNPGDWYSQYLPINYATSQQRVEFKHVYPDRQDIMPEQSDYIRSYVDTFETALLDPGFADPAAGYRRYMDEKSFIDFLIVNEFSVNYDSYGRSTYLYKDKVTNGGKIKIGPPWDYDRAMDYYNPGTAEGWVWELTHPYWPFPFWWSRLWEDERYRKQLACRWTMLRQNTLSTPAFIQLIDSTVGVIQESQERNFKFWNDLGNWTYQQNVDSLKSYMLRRLNWIDATLAAQQVSAPNVPSGMDISLCSGATFDAAPVFGAQFDYNWQPGPDTSTIQFEHSGLYTVRISDTYGCYARSTLNVTVFPETDAGFISQQQGGGSTWLFTPNLGSGSSYLWNFGDGTTSTEKSPVHQYAALGDYLVTLTVVDEHGCPAQTHQETIHFTTSDIAETGADDASITPNPFDRQFSVTFGQASGSETIMRLENSLGQNVMTLRVPAGAHAGTFNTEQLPAGVYLLHISREGKQTAAKLVRI